MLQTHPADGAFAVAATLRHAGASRASGTRTGSGSAEQGSGNGSNTLTDSARLISLSGVPRCVTTCVETAASTAGCGSDVAVDCFRVLESGPRVPLLRRSPRLLRPTHPLFWYRRNQKCSDRPDRTFEFGVHICINDATDSAADAGATLANAATSAPRAHSQFKLPYLNASLRQSAQVHRSFLPHTHAYGFVRKSSHRPFKSLGGVELPASPLPRSTHPWELCEVPFSRRDLLEEKRKHKCNFELGEYLGYREPKREDSKDVSKHEVIRAHEAEIAALQRKLWEASRTDVVEQRRE
ncbi:hypothetical protein B0H16DRAFT_1741735 [Mycena metata]|uniref:Uncharacterized protein n=1 Tax=Mycena metata TaxID=1033252 RepID=A0AAD7H9J1_9AGAR|nr:hypothetical protein B0H16DRAFT_1741735 [Mycena metata]